jgi:hypothetical protein
MALFGFWTLKNIRQVHRATQHSHSMNTGSIVIGRPYRLQSKDRQLIRMLLVDILSYLLCKCLVTIFYIYQQITQYQKRDLRTTTNRRINFTISIFLVFP